MGDCSGGGVAAVAACVVGVGGGGGGGGSGGVALVCLLLLLLLVLLLPSPLPPLYIMLLCTWHPKTSVTCLDVSGLGLEAAEGFDADVPSSVLM